jgi:hypothetical protein
MITKDFLLAGHAIFTVENTTGDHWTYRVSACEGNPDIMFVSLLTGPQNTSDYTYLGLLIVKDAIVRLTKKSAYSEDTKAVQIIRRVICRLYDGQGSVIEAAGWKVHHIGKCGRCGRPLTTPASIESGIGPICEGKMD